MPTENEEPQGVGVLWKPPGWMDGEQRDAWNYAVDHAPVGLLSETDADALAIWCCARVEWQRAVIEVRRHGQFVKTKATHSPIVWKVDKRTGKKKKTGGKVLSRGNVIQNPALAVMNKQAMIMLKVGGELGFSPAARTALARSTGRELDNATAIGGGRALPSAKTGLAAYLDEKPDDLPN